MSKTVKESLEARQLSAPRLLRDINIFLVMIPPAEWRRRATDNVPLADMPLRTVKTILQQIVSVYGEQVFDQLEEVESAENSFVYQYLFRLASNTGTGAVEAARLSRQPSSSSSAGPGLRTAYARELPASPPLTGSDSPILTNGLSLPNGHGDAPTAAAVPSTGGPEIEMNQRLKVIFDLIGDPVNSRTVRALFICLKTWNTDSFFRTGYCGALRIPKATPRGGRSNRDLVRFSHSVIFENFS